MLSFLIDNFFFSGMTPPTANTIVLVPLFSIAQRSVPSEPSSVSLVTVYTVPPAPPVVYLPAPSAPGKAGVYCRSGSWVSDWLLSGSCSDGRGDAMGSVFEQAIIRKLRIIVDNILFMV